MKVAELPVATRKRAVQHLKTLDLVVVGTAIDSVAEGVAQDAVYAVHTEFVCIAAVAVGTDHTALDRILAAAEVVHLTQIDLAAAVAVEEEDTG
jgi:hypothetical protein